MTMHSSTMVHNYFFVRYPFVSRFDGCYWTCDYKTKARKQKCSRATAYSIRTGRTRQCTCSETDHRSPCHHSVVPVCSCISCDRGCIGRPTGTTRWIDQCSEIKIGKQQESKTWTLRALKAGKLHVKSPFDKQRGRGLVKEGERVCGVSWPCFDSLASRWPHVAGGGGLS